jgi:hypothetical protein
MFLARRMRQKKPLRRAKLFQRLRVPHDGSVAERLIGDTILADTR